MKDKFFNDTFPEGDIEPTNIFRLAKIIDKCVKYEIWAQTCSVEEIKLIKITVAYLGECEDAYMETF